MNTLSTFESSFTHNANKWALRSIIAAKGDLHVSITNNNEIWTIRTLLGMDMQYPSKNSAIFGIFEAGYTPVAFLYFHNNSLEGKKEDVEWKNR